MPYVITPCVYAQQGNAFGCIGLCILWYTVADPEIKKEEGARSKSY